MNEQHHQMKLLLVDWPNLHARTLEFVGRKPAAHERPSLAALADWFSARLTASERGSAVVFANAPEPMTAGFCQWAHRLRLRGYGVYAKPRHEGTDIDADLLRHASDAVAAGGVNEVVLVSSDLYRDHPIDGVEPLVALAMQAQITVVGFAEKVSRYASAHGEVAFVDPAEIHGFLPKQMTERRTHLVLPSEGALLAPLAAMRGATTVLAAA